jgi:hypothetical protein
MIKDKNSGLSYWVTKGIIIFMKFIYTQNGMADCIKGQVMTVLTTSTEQYWKSVTASI